ncbi:uncharacterized protein [Temnothorax longispinosus]|uniref:uncharacterized protein n=1 Tax=Temnothorax longispinosus TaxID=300112 RepID=UPI003A9A5045
MSFGYCIATLLEFAGIHYFTKVGSGEIPLDDEEWEEWKGIASEEFEDTFRTMIFAAALRLFIRRLSIRILESVVPSCPHYTVTASHTKEIPAIPSRSPFLQNRRPWRDRRKLSLFYRYGRQFLYCLAGDDAFRRRRQREAASNYRKCGDRMSRRHKNSVSYIDRVARIVFPASFGLLNVCYWVAYVTYQEEFKWQDPPIGSITSISH